MGRCAAVSTEWSRNSWCLEMKVCVCLLFVCLFFRTIAEGYLFLHLTCSIVVSGMIAASFLFNEHPVVSTSPTTPSSSMSVPPSSHSSKQSSYKVPSGFPSNHPHHQNEIADLYAFAFLVPV